MTLPDTALAADIAAASDGDTAAAERLATQLRERHAANRDRPDPRVLDRWAVVDAHDLDAHRDGFAAMHHGTHDGYLIRGVLTPEEAESFTRRTLASGLLHDNVGGRLLGMSLLGLPDRRPYYPAATETRPRIEQLFGFSFEERVEDVLHRLGGGRDVRLPTEGEGETYLPATIRVLDENGGGYRAHTGNEFVETYASYDHLRSIARTTDALSYFVLTQCPREGGELVIYDLSWDETPEEFGSEFMTATRDARLEAVPKAYVDPQPGDMILFNGGRIWHKVADIIGPDPRVTVGGFATLSADERTIYYWN